MNEERRSNGGGDEPVSVLVIGTGAIGGCFGGILARAGAEVSVVARSEYDVIKERGIHIESPEGEFLFRPRRVLRSPEEFGDPPRVVLIATKVVPGVDLPGLIRPVVGKDTAITLIQNGIHIEAPVADAFPENELVSGLAFTGIERPAPGRLRRRDGGRLVLGRYPAGVSDTARTLCSLVKSTGMPCEVTERIETERWRKLVWNAAYNPVSVLGGGIDTHTILEDPPSKDLIVKLMTEVMRVAAAHGHELPESLLRQNLDGTRASKPYKTSMALDLEAGRSMEVEAILGNAVRAARRSGVNVPHMESLYALLRLLDVKRGDRAAKAVYR